MTTSGHPASTEELLISGQDIYEALAMRTPEQTALIALKGLLEAREMYIHRLEVSTRPIQQHTN